MIRRISASALLFTLAVFPLAAQETAKPKSEAAATVTTTTTTTTTMPPVDTSDPDLKNPDAIRISLSDVIKTSAERNLGVVLDVYDYREAGYSAREAYSPFDWFTSASGQIDSQKTPQSQSIFSSQTKDRSADFGLSHLFATGANLDATFNNQRQSSNSQFNTFNPAISSGLSASLTQPLLRNFGVDVTRRGIRVARNTLGISEEAFRNELIQTVYLAVQAYNNLVFARENYVVQKESLALVEDQQRITQIRINVGASAPLDILQPQVAVATNEEAVIAAEASIRNAEDQIRQLMHTDPAGWDKPILPTEAAEYTPMTVNLADSVSRAMQLRPELKQALYDEDTKKIDYLFARNQALPKLDLALSYGSAGLAGTEFATDPITGQQTVVGTTGFSHALNQVLQLDSPSWTLGLNFAFPIHNIGALAEAKRTELDLQRSAVSQDQVRESIEIDVRTTARAIDTLAKEIVATKTAREAAEKNLDAERKRFENGLSTNFEVLTIQQNLSTARSTEIQALVAYQNAVANYHRSVGDLLDVHDIVVDPPENFDMPRSPLESIPWLNYGNWLSPSTKDAIENPNKDADTTARGVNGANGKQ